MPKIWQKMMKNYWGTCLIKALTGLSYQEFSDLVPVFKKSMHELRMQKQENTILSHFRVCVEHAIGGMKRFRAYADVFRNRLGYLDDQIALLAAGLWNYHLAYTA